MSPMETLGCTLKKRVWDPADLMASRLGSLLWMPWELGLCSLGTLSELLYGWDQGEEEEITNVASGT